MIIRKSTLNDINDILELLKKTKEELWKKNINIWNNGYPDIADFLEDVNTNTGFVVEDDHLIIGYAAVYANSNHSIDSIIKGKTGYAMRIMVSPEFQRQGVGRNLLNFIEEMDYEYIHIFVHKINENAIIFYKKMGYNILIDSITLHDMEFVYMERAI